MNERIKTENKTVENTEADPCIYENQPMISTEFQMSGNKLFNICLRVYWLGGSKS